jgi:hypothetical protein
MNFIKLLSALLLLPFLSISQIPNASFEDWTNFIPDGWATNVSPPLLPVSSSTDAHTGLYALKGEVVNDAGIAFGPFIQPLNSAGFGFPVSNNDTMLYGFYKSGVIGGNLGLVEVWAYDSLLMQVGAGYGYLDSQATYKEFAIPVIYVPGSQAKYMVIIIQMTDTAISGSFNVGSYFLIDDLSFTKTSTVDIRHAEKLNYCVSPNPATDFINISGAFDSRKKQYLSIYDVTGKKIVHEIVQSADNNVSIDVQNIPAGNYILLMTDGQHSVSEKIIISR